MPHRLRLHVFVDALGWAIVDRLRAFPELDAVRRPLGTQFGYSSACLPTILSGAPPRAHGHWNLYRRAAGAGAFEALRPLGLLPGLLRVPGRLQRPVSALLARALGLEGYFALHRVPLQRLWELDVDERRDLLRPGALPRTGSIVDEAAASGRAVHLSDWRAPEAARWAALEADLRRRRLDWAFLYLAELDGCLHRAGRPTTEVEARVRADERRLRALVTAATGLGYRVEVALFSDHGMCPVGREVDLRAEVRRAVPAREGRDYLAFYDSTMARFWSDDAGLLERLAAAVAPRARVLDAAARAAWGIDFAGPEHGQVVALLPPGDVIAPSDMGRRAPRGMHGYDPAHDDSHAALLASFEPEVEPTRLQELRGLMAAGLRPAAAA